MRNTSIKYLAQKKISGDAITFGAVIISDFVTVIIGAIFSIWNYGYNDISYNEYYKEDMEEFTWNRFGWTLFIGFFIYIQLAFTAIGNQKGYAGLDFLNIFV